MTPARRRAEKAYREGLELLDKAAREIWQARNEIGDVLTDHEETDLTCATALITSVARQIRARIADSRRDKRRAGTGIGQ